MSGFKILTHDLCPPIQGGPPLWSGTLPFTLPPVRLDTSEADCSSGWDYCAELPTALRIAGRWPNGRPSRAFAVEPGTDAISRGDKCRASTLTLVREVDEEEIGAAVLELSQVFGPHAERMAQEQMAWRQALRRVERDAARVEAGLRAALEARGLGEWETQEFSSAWDAWAAWDAWDALTVLYAGLQGWIDQQPELLTTGIRDAYGAGLAVAVPTGPKTLGYALVKASR